MLEGRLSVPLPDRLPAQDCNMLLSEAGDVRAWLTVKRHARPSASIMITGAEGQVAVVWLGSEDSHFPVGTYLSGNPTEKGGAYFAEDQLRQFVEQALAQLTDNL